MKRSMQRVFARAVIAAIFSGSISGAIAAPLKGYTPRIPLFYERHSDNLDVEGVELLTKHLKSLEEKNTPEAELLPVMSGLALLIRQTDKDKAIELFKKSLAIREKLNDKNSEDYRNDLEGYIEAAMGTGDARTADELLNKLIPLATEYDAKHKLKFDLVECYTDQENYPRAEDLMLSTIKQNEAVGQCFAKEMLGAAEWYARQKRFNEAKPWFLRAISKAKAENDPSGAKRIETAMYKYFVRETKPADVAALLKKSAPQIVLSDTSASLQLGSEGGISYGLNVSPAKLEDGKPVPEEEWVKRYRLALTKFRQKNYSHAEALFKDGCAKFKGNKEAVAFDVGLAKLYQETKNTQKLNETLASMVKNYGNGSPPPSFRVLSGGDATPKPNTQTTKPL